VKFTGDKPYHTTYTLYCVAATAAEPEGSAGLFRFIDESKEIVFLLNRISRFEPSSQTV
jgi:hypothetical protein